MRIVICSGGYDPIHSGHIAYFLAARALGDKLIVGVNSDAWLVRKKGRPFMPVTERTAIIKNLKMVDGVVLFNDDDNTAIRAITAVRMLYPNDTIIFANGGDRTKENIPEMVVEGVEFVFGVGGENKINSSSWILKEFQYPKEERVWGNFSNLFQDENVKVKELVIAPKSGISYQRHFKRNELWYVSKGECFLKFADGNTPDDYGTLHLDPTSAPIVILAGDWHQAYNTSDKPCHIIEIQYGEETVEDDIERISLYGE